jgi:hypothetical protein
MPSVNFTQQQIQILYDLLINTAVKGPGRRAFIEIEDILLKAGAKEPGQEKVEEK